MFPFIFKLSDLKCNYYITIVYTIKLKHFILYIFHEVLKLQHKNILTYKKIMSVANN